MISWFKWRRSERRRDIDRAMATQEDAKRRLEKVLQRARVQRDEDINEMLAGLVPKHHKGKPE